VIEVERVPIDQVVPQRRDPWQENDALIVPIYEERLVVERQIVLKEQLRVTRSSRTIGHQVSGTIRRERIVVEDPGNAVREVPPESISASDTTSPMPDSGNSYKPN
jgi:stress response protein YsnF